MVPGGGCRSLGCRGYLCALFDARISFGTTTCFHRHLPQAHLLPMSLIKFHVIWSAMLLVCLYRPQAPSHNQASTETPENRAPPSDQGSASTVNSGCEVGKTVSNSSEDSVSECLDTAGSDLGKVSFTPGHARSFSEPPYSRHSQIGRAHV